MSRRGHMCCCVLPACSGCAQVLASEYGFTDIYNGCLFRLLLRHKNTGPADAVLYDMPLGWWDHDWKDCFNSRCAVYWHPYEPPRPRTHWLCCWLLHPTTAWPSSQCKCQGSVRAKGGADTCTALSVLPRYSQYFCSRKVHVVEAQPGDPAWHCMSVQYLVSAYVCWHPGRI
jgi:hypothetical protein